MNSIPERKDLTSPTHTSPNSESQGDISTHQSEKLATNISGTAERLLSHVEEIYMTLPDFFFFNKEKGLYIVLNVLFSQKWFREFIEEIVFDKQLRHSSTSREWNANYPRAFFRWLNYKLFSRLLYGDVSKLGEEWDAIKPDIVKESVKLFRLADSIESLPEEDRDWYNPRNLSKSNSKTGTTVSYFFERRIREIDDETKPIFDPDTKKLDWYKKKDIYVPLDVDKIIAFFYVNGIKANLDYDQVSRPLDSTKPMGEGRIIARTILPEAWREAKPIYMESTEKNFWAKQVATSGKEWGARYNLAEWEMWVVHVDANKGFLVTEVPAKPWKPWLEFDGTILKPASVSLDSKLPALAGKNVRIEKRGDVYGLVATIDWFYLRDPKTGRISVEEDVHLSQVSLKETGGGITWGSDRKEADFHISGDIKRHLRVPSISCSGDIEVQSSQIEAYMTLSNWVMATEWDILVGGWIFSWHLFALHGNITIGGTDIWITSDIVWRILDKAVVRAPRGVVKFNDALWGVIIGKKVIGKLARNTLIIAEEVEMEECFGCMVIFTKRASIAKTMSAGNKGESSTLIYSSEDISWIIEEDKKNSTQYQKWEELLKILEETPKIMARHRADEKISKEDIAIVQQYQTLDPRYKTNEALSKIKVTLESLLPKIQALSERIDFWKESGYSVWNISNTTVVHGDFTISTKENDLKDIFYRKPFLGPRVRKWADLTPTEKHYAALQENRNGYWEKKLLAGNYPRREYKNERLLEFKNAQ